MSSNEKLWSVVAHLGGVAYLSSLLTQIPIVNIVIPLVVWLVKRDDSSFVDDHGREALNFQISITLYHTVAFLSIFVGIGLFLVPAVSLFNFIQTLIAVIKAGQGKEYRYFLSIRFVR